MPLPNQLPSNFSDAKQEKIVFRNRYVLDKKLGAGNFGTAYLIFDNEAPGDDNKKVLKQICVGTIDPGETVDAMHEAKLLSRLQHRSIVQFHESFLDGQFFCIVTEFCEGGDLDVRLQECRKQQSTISEEQVVKWLKQLLQALEYMHGRRILHRDLKTKNIFLKGNKVKVGDFGISRILMGTSDMASTFVGTPYYMSPEVLKHEHYDEKCDIWSLGCVLYEMCCLKHAFEGKSLMSVMYKIVQGDTPELSKAYSQALNIILCKMLARDASQRQTAKEILGYNIFTSSKSNLTPKERMRLKKQKAADEQFRKHQELATRNFRENERRHKESLTKNFHHTSVEAAMQNRKEPDNLRTLSEGDSSPNNGVFHATSKGQTTKDDNEDTGTLVVGGKFNNPKKFSSKIKSKTFSPSKNSSMNVNKSSTMPRGGIDELRVSEGNNQTLTSTSEELPFDGESTAELAASLIKDGYIPEDALLAETYYSLQEDFESDQDFESDLELPDDHVHLSDTEYKEMLECMEDALDMAGSVTTVPHAKSKTLSKPKINGSDQLTSKLDNAKEPPSALVKNVRDTQINNIKESCIYSMGEGVFDEAYSYLRSVWSNHVLPVAADYKSVMTKLNKIVNDDNLCFKLEQLIYLENEKEQGF
uniref:serine/threonine-protein kinase Nek11-like n=1 Tax=Styela clava TaxID=7725 RepID=UPI00193940ED|nr:serine/threonine-protein kinase Nek11-like [Styela clava]